MKKYPRYYREGKSYKLTDEEILDAKTMRTQGCTLKEIGGKLKVSWQAIHYHTSEETNKKVRERRMKEFLGMSEEERVLDNERKREGMREKYKRQPKEMEEYRPRATIERLLELHPQLKEVVNYENNSHKDN